MKTALPSLACLAAVIAGHSVFASDSDRSSENYQKARRGLVANEIRAGMPCERMLDVCHPALRRTLGRFTEYVFESIPGYHGLTIIAVDERLKRATEWSCTYARTHFDELTADEDALYRQVGRDYAHVPFETCIGRYSWQRARMRDWPTR